MTTAAVAEQLYDALIVWNQQKSLTVTKTSLAFFRQFTPSVTTGTYRSSSSTYTALTRAIKTFADGFIAINAKYTPANGALSEQFDRNTGAPTSASDLTWSYAASLTAFAARRGVVSASWGAKGLKIPTVCKPNPGPTVQATFNVIATTEVGGTSIYFNAAECSKLIMFCAKKTSSLRDRSTPSKDGVLTTLCHCLPPTTPLGAVSTSHGFSHRCFFSHLILF